MRNFNNPSRHRLRRLIGAVGRVGLIALFAWAVYTVSGASIRRPDLPLGARIALSVIAVALAVLAAYLIYTLFRWLRRQKLIIDIAEMVYDRSDGKGMLHTETTDGTLMSWFVNNNSGVLVLAGELDSTVYFILPSGLVVSQQSTDILLDPTNSPTQRSMRWSTSSRSWIPSKGEDEIAMTVRQYIDQVHRD